MSSSSSSSQGLSLDFIKFVQNHIPALKDGVYQAELEQTVTGPGIGTTAGTGNTFTASKTFFVAGPRFALEPTVINSIFPPEGGIGNYNNVLPSVMFNRSTLPWEREVFDSKTGGSSSSAINDKVTEETPWLTLLLFDQSEVESGQVSKPYQKTVADVESQLGLSAQPAEDMGQKVNLIDIQEDLIDAILPTYQELTWLAHCRETEVEVLQPNSQMDVTVQEQAVVFGNRLPKIGSVSTVFLVSMEDRLDGAGKLRSQNADGSYTFIVLKSWSFTVPDEQPYEVTPFALERIKAIMPSGTSPDLIDGLAAMAPIYYRDTADFTRALATIGLTSSSAPGNIPVTVGSSSSSGTGAPTFFDQVLTYAKKPRETFKDLLFGVNHDPWYFALPDNPKVTNAVAKSLFAKGSVLLKHELRQGGKTRSFYRGPFVPGQDSNRVQLPVLASDELLIYYNDLGMFDTSYAAAWELGRQIALADKNFSKELYTWKKDLVKHDKQEDQLTTDEEVALLLWMFPEKKSVEAPPVPDKVRQWFTNLRLLKKVPFSYLVPDAALLPNESIRFFQTDPMWIECLVDGAFSIGRVTAADVKQDANIYDTFQDDPAFDRAINSSSSDTFVGPKTGFLLRSALVSGWPNLQVNGYPIAITDTGEARYDKDRVPYIRFERLGPGLLLVMYDGIIKTIDIHQHPEALHSGVSYDPENTTSPYTKNLRNLNGTYTQSPANPNVPESVPVPFRSAAPPAYYHSSSSGFSSSSGSSTVPGIDFGQLQVVDVSALATSINGVLKATTFTSAEFGLQMIEGVDLVRFTNNT